MVFAEIVIKHEEHGLIKKIRESSNREGKIQPTNLTWLQL